MGQLHEAGDAVAATGLVIGLVPAVGSFIIAAGAERRGDMAAYEYFGDAGLWFSGLTVVLLAIGFGMMWAGRDRSKPA